jgi:hypothetical protein
VVTKPPVRSATSFAKVTRPIPEMLFCGYSVVIRHTTCADAGTAESTSIAADMNAGQLRINLGGGRQAQ